MADESETPGAIEPVAESEAAGETEVSRKPSWPKRLLRGAAMAVASVLGLIVAAYFLLDTSPGRRLVADVIESYEMENGVRFSVGRIDGSIYGEMVLHDLSVFDQKGEFVYSPEVHVDWRPFAFLSDHVDVRSATAEKMMLRRLPELREVPDTGEPLLPDLDIDIGKLEITRFIAEKPVTGEEQVATITGTAHIASGRAQVRLTALTVAGKDRAGGDRLVAILDAVPEENRLDVDLDINAPRDGVVAALAGLTRNLDVKIKGKGDWKAWNGSLNAQYGGARLTELALSARDGTIGIKGPAMLAGLLSAPTNNLFRPVTNIDLQAVLGVRSADLSGSVTSDAFRLNTNGLVDLSDNSFSDFKLAFVLLQPSALAENLRGSGLRAMLTLNGEFAAPRVQYALNAARIMFNDMGLEQFSAKGVARIDPDGIIVPVSAQVRRIVGLDSVAGGSLTDVRLNGDIAIDGARILSDNMRIRSNRIDSRLILLANLETGLYTGAIDGKLDSYRVESVGIFNIETDMDLEARADGGFALKGRVRARSTQLLNDSLKEYLGGNFVAASDVRYGGDGTFRLSNLRLEAPLLRVVGGSGSYSADGRIALNANATSKQYGKIGVRIAGTIANPDARITADRPDLGIGLANLEARIIGAKGGYRLDLKSDTDYGLLTADVTLGTSGATSLTINRAELAGIGFSGSMRQTKAGPFAGRLTAEGNGLGGVIELSSQGRYQAAQFNIRANNTVLSGPTRVSIGSAIIDGNAVLYDQPHIVADVQLADTQYGAFDLNAARMKINYRDGRGKLQALVEGRSGAPFRVAANADLQPDLWRVVLDGKVRGQAFKTTSPARIIPRNGEYELLPTQLSVGGGTARIAGIYGKGMKLQSRIEGVNMAMINAFVPGYGIGGRASGSLDFQQTSSAAFPRADARLTLDDFTRTTASSVSQPVDINFVGKLLADGGEARAVIRRRGSVIGRMKASLRPLPPGAGPWMDRLMGAPLGGGIRYNGPADTLFSFAGQADQRLSGPIGVAADFSCKVANPCVSGIVRGRKLVYENLTYGTKLTNLTFDGSFDGNRMQVQKLTANAGDGTVSATGYVSLASEAGYPMDVAVTLSQAQLARSVGLSAAATGQLRLAKNTGQTAMLSGQLRLPETRYQIVMEGAAQVPQLTGVRFKPRLRRQRITGEEPAEQLASMFSLLRLDIDLVAPEKLYVAGMGLESEWKANLTVKGTSSEPRMAGSVDLIRGTLGFAGKSFELTKGNIRFTGGSAFDPELSIVASEDVDDITVNVDVGGRAMDPKIAFSSVPNLPQDEILSRILFGSSVANISAIQAVQLAASLNSLRGSGGGLNPLGKLRSATGIDRLRIVGPDEDSGRGTALAAGQYITDDIYVELITDTRGFTATQLEVSITSWLSVLSTAGGSGANNVNVRIKKDY